jgi:methylated-DNA-protein-cysteine methyltransferase-like protein
MLEPDVPGGGAWPQRRTEPLTRAQVPLSHRPPSSYERIYAVVCEIPRGRVATYGRIAFFLERCTARKVGYAMAAVPAGSDVPWQRVINSQGRCSRRAHGDGHVVQRALLEQEGIVFDARGRVDLRRFGWRP